MTAIDTQPELCCDRRRRWREAGLSIAVFAAVLAAYISTSNTTSWDSRWTVHVALNILHHGRTDLDSFMPTLEANDFYGVERFKGHYYNRYPLGPSLVALPFVFVFDEVDGYFGYDLVHLAEMSHHNRFEAVVASILTALTVLLVFRIARRQLSIPWSLLATFIFAFATPAWSTASRAMWGHTPTILMLTLAIWMTLQAQKRPVWAALSALPLAMTIVCRPNNVLPLAAMGLYVLIKFRRQLPLFVVLAIAVLAPFAAYMHSIYGQWLSPYYQTDGWGNEGSFWVGLAGQTVSPSRGILIASPVLLLVPAGFYLQLRARRLTLLEGVCGAMVVANLLLISAWPWWWGGHSLGPRLWTDALPFMMMLVIPALSALAAARGRRKLAAVAIVVVLAAWSFGVHYSLSNSKGTQAWNAKLPDGTPANVDTNRWRLWDWSDPQFLRQKN